MQLPYENMRLEKLEYKDELMNNLKVGLHIYCDYKL